MCINKGFVISIGGTKRFISNVVFINDYNLNPKALRIVGTITLLGFAA